MLARRFTCAAALDFDTEQAGLIKQRVERSGVAFVAEFPRRQAPATLRLKELIATRLGSPRLMFCHQRVPTETGGGQGPRGLAKAVVSRTHDLVELVDWCRYVAGSDATSVLGLSHVTKTDPPQVDYEMMSLDFSGPEGPGTRCTAQISSGRYMPACWPEAVAYRPPAGVASGLRGRHRVCGPALDVGVVRQGGSAHGSRSTASDRWESRCCRSFTVP